MGSYWEAEVQKWESEPYLIQADSLDQLLDQLPPHSEISRLHIYQISNPNY